MSSARYLETETRNPAPMHIPPPTASASTSNQESEKYELRSKHLCYRIFLFIKDISIICMELGSFGSAIQGTVGSDKIVVQDPAFNSSLESARSRVKTMNGFIIAFTIIMGVTELTYLYITFRKNYQYLFKGKFEGEEARTQKKWIKRILEVISLIVSIIVFFLAVGVYSEVSKGYSQETKDVCSDSLASLGKSLGLEVGIFILSLIFDCDFARECFEDIKTVTKHAENILPKN